MMANMVIFPTERRNFFEQGLSEITRYQRLSSTILAQMSTTPYMLLEQCRSSLSQVTEMTQAEPQTSVSPDWSLHHRFVRLVNFILSVLTEGISGGFANTGSTEAGCLLLPDRTLYPGISTVSPLAFRQSGCRASI